jgi:ligand-binding SRPBCC domain-containing protein
LPKIVLTTYIKASRELVFDLNRSVDIHEQSTQQTNERAIAGKTSGLLEINDSVTWRAKHLGFYQNLTVKITSMNAPHNFVDEMVKGAFKSFQHCHRFQQEGEFTKMTDVFLYTSPLGPIGRLADILFLKRYLRRFLIHRNTHIKKIAEQKKSVQLNQTL